MHIFNKISFSPIVFHAFKTSNLLAISYQKLLHFYNALLLFRSQASPIYAILIYYFGCDGNNKLASKRLEKAGNMRMRQRRANIKAILDLSY